MRGLVMCVAWVSMIGCGGTEDIEEGREAGDCSDGADNDGDGAFDCLDPGCNGSPDCEDVGGNPTATGSGTGTGTGTGGPDTGETGSGTTDWTADPCVTMGMLSVNWQWVDDGGLPPGSCGDRLNIQICDPIGEVNWNLGMAETSAGGAGWYGEDCLAGGPPLVACHAIRFEDYVDEVPTCAPGDVADGFTLFDYSKDPGNGSQFLTYYIEDSLGYCFAWGDDPSYYASVGCGALLTM